MIISHGKWNFDENKIQKPFIFLNPPQTGGTVIEAALLPYLGKADNITPHKEFKGQNTDIFYNHINATELYKKAKYIYEAYPKITIIRDPWDTVMSLYRKEVEYVDQPITKKFWSRKEIIPAIQQMKSSYGRKFLKEVDSIKKEISIFDQKDKNKRIGIEDFFTFAQKMPSQWNKYEYHFLNGAKACDIYLHYATLQSDVNKFCKEFNIPQIKLKSEQLPNINEVEFGVENLERYVNNNPYILHENGRLKSDETLHKILSKHITEAAGRVHWNYETLLSKINKKNTKGKYIDEAIKVNGFNYEKITPERIDAIVTTYLNKKI